MLYQQQTFTCPVNTTRMSDELWRYRTGQISAEEYLKLTGKKPDQED